MKNEKHISKFDMVKKRSLVKINGIIFKLYDENMYGQ